MVGVCCCGDKARKTHGVLNLEATIYTCAKDSQTSCTYCMERPNKCHTAGGVPVTRTPMYSFEGENMLANRRFQQHANRCCGYADNNLASLFTVPRGGVASPDTLVDNATELAELYPVLCNSIMRDALSTQKNPWQVGKGGNSVFTEVWPLLILSMTHSTVG